MKHSEEIAKRLDELARLHEELAKLFETDGDHDLAQAEHLSSQTCERVAASVRSRFKTPEA